MDVTPRPNDHSPNALFQSVFVSSILVIGAAYLIEAIRPGFVSSFIPVNVSLLIGLALALALILTGSGNFGRRYQMVLLATALFSASVFLMEGLSLSVRLIVIVVWLGIALAYWTMKSVDVPDVR